MSKPNPMGDTFAERKAAAAGADEFEVPEPQHRSAGGNTTFAERAGRKPSAKAVDEDTDGAENKAVAPKKTASKRVSKKS